MLSAYHASPYKAQSWVKLLPSRSSKLAKDSKLETKNASTMNALCTDEVDTKNTVYRRTGKHKFSWKMCTQKNHQYITCADGTSKVEDVGRDWGPLLGLLENCEEEWSAQWKGWHGWRWGWRWRWSEPFSKDQHSPLHETRQWLLAPSKFNGSQVKVMFFLVFDLLTNC